MKILFVTDLYPVKPEEITTPVTLHNFVIEWIKQGHQVDIIKPNFIFNSFLRGKFFYKTGLYEFEGARIFNVNYFTPFLFNITKKLTQEDKRHRGIKASQSISHASKNFILNQEYDVIIAHMPSGIIFANKLGVNANLVCAIHCSDIEVLTNPLYKFYFKKQLENAYKNAKGIACRSFALQKKFNKLMPDCAHKTFVVPSGILAKCKIQNANRIPFPIHHSLFTILTCANLIKRKNIDKLILAINDLEGFELKIIGDGKELNYLKKIACSKVNFLGRLPHEKVLDEMQKSDIFILPSVNETFGMVYLEAMASGCITVCTKNDGIDGIIKDGENGFLCEPTIEGIKETLLKIKNYEDTEKIVEKGLKKVEKYNQETCAKNYLESVKKKILLPSLSEKF